ncbi:fatty acyl-CoA reductase wat isoform X1 [Nasonia vitripennis]|uniref:Fatty acyl-CoA reductase n=1 Tax=Nasonia vitripennis TaxID=7425 RepID=A0A7M7G2Q3_NASVI|nr:fatty acyl-CoA reductase wat isoform X1 [Nasonia vitripennis]
MDQHYEKMRDDLECLPAPVVGSSKIQDYFAGKSVFVTGATGFMGKCFVEKILRDCPDLKRLYVLVRPKKGVPLEDKMRRYFGNYIFDRVRSEQPRFEEKVVTVRGDLQEDRLGISAEDRRELIEQVDVIVHGGATVKFDEVVSVALKINVLATRQMLELASECRRLLCFAYVSTAYSHCYQQHIEEKFYEPPGDLQIVQDMIASDEAAVGGLSDDAIKMLLGKWPNIYTFSKSMAEELVRQYSERCNLPACVYRPSVVSAAYSEPLPGWIGNNNGPAYGFFGSAVGAIHTTYYENKPFDLVPVDYSINALLAAVYDCPNRWREEGRAVVYNYGSSTVRPTYLDVIFANLLEEAPHLGSMNTLWHPFVIFVDRKWLFLLLHFLLHFIPACLADLALLCIGQKPRALKLFWLATSNMSKIYYFLNGDWKIHVPEMRKVLDRLSPRDRQIFPYDMRDFDWFDFTVRYMRSFRVYVLKEPTDNVREAVRRYHRMHLLHRVTVALFFLLLAYCATRLLTCLASVVI